MKPFRRFFPWVLAVLALSGTTGLHATVLQALTVEDLTNASDRVALARVEKISPDLGPKTPGFSYVALRILESYKGSASDSVTIKLLGGQTSDDPASQLIEGVPTFRPDEAGVFFLRVRPEENGQYYNVTGWNQGKWELERDGATLTNGKLLKELVGEVREAVKHPKPSKLKHGRGSDKRRDQSTGVPAKTKHLPTLNPARVKRVLHSDGGDPNHPGPLTDEERVKKRGVE